MKRPILAAALLAVAAIASAPVIAQPSRDHDYDPPIPGTYRLPVIKPAAGGSVVDSFGRDQNLGDLTRGKATVLSFIYTRCASARACPYATGVLNQLHLASQRDEKLAEGMRLVSLSFDPAMDTPERMAAYSSWAAKRDASADWHFLTTRAERDLAPILEAYNQAVDRRKDPGHPLGPLNHTLRVYLIDRAGQIRNIYSSGTLDVRLVLADVRTLLAEN